MKIFFFSMICVVGAFFSFATGALPPIVFFTYTPPAPVFQLIGSVPQDHQTFNISPEKVSLSFNEALNPTNAEIKLYDPSNNPIESKNTLPNSTSIETPVPPHLYSGTYRADWKVQCGCAGKTPLNGTLYFTVY